MAIEISTAFVILILPATLAENDYIGYNYRAPVLRPQMPINNRPPNQQLYYHHMPELQNGFLPSPVYNQQYNSDMYRNQLLPTQHALYYNQGYHSAQSTHQNTNYNSFTPSVSNGKLIEPQNLQQNVQDSPIGYPSYTNAQHQPPVITKHIYFHLPPDDNDNVASVTPSPPKKTYNIIFIKLPSQESTNAARLQQIINQQAAAVESKTLIYVLTKKPEAQTVQPVTSKPEVFFVKYKEPRNVLQPVNSGLVQVQVPQSSIPALQPGQVNGHGLQ